MDNSDLTPLEEDLLALADRIDGGEEGGLGFVESPDQQTWVHLNRDEIDEGGHIYDEDGTPQALPGEAVAGYVEDVRYYSTQHEKHGLLQYLLVNLDVGAENFLVRTGFFTNTAKALLSRLAHVEDPGSVVTIEPSLPDDPDENPNVLFVEVYEEGRRITGNSEWPEDAEDHVDLFHYVREEIFGLEPQEETPQLPEESGSGRSSNGRSGSGRSRSGRSSNGRSSNGRDQLASRPRPEGRRSSAVADRSGGDSRR